MTSKLDTGQHYDDIPYPCGAYPQSHPDRLAVIGTLFGMTPARVDACRVLELGCADGSNLIPMAVNLPNSEFVGLDLSQRQIAESRRVAEQLDLSNIRFLHESIAHVDASLGTFDYIIAHGIFSWVPREVQQRMFELCRRQLAPQGIAYISYNTYPGWRMRGMLRDMMIYHTRRFSDPHQQVQQARALIRFLADEVPATDDPYGLLLKQELAEMHGWDDNYFRHDSLEEVNDPVYFHEFVQRASQHGLRYLGEAEFPTMLIDQLSRSASSTLELVATDQVDLEQYMDFVDNRMFRQTLLCHEKVIPTRNVSADRVKQLRAAARLDPIGDAFDITSRGSLEFRTATGQGIKARRPLLKSALLVLRDIWPASIVFNDLVTEAHKRLGHSAGDSNDDGDAAGLANMLLRAYTADLIRLHTWEPRLSARVSKCPQASRLAQFQAATRRAVTTQQHEDAELDEPTRRLLALLDGTHDRGQLLSKLSAGNSGEQPEDLPETHDGELESCLERLAECSLLVG